MSTISIYKSNDCGQASLHAMLEFSILTFTESDRTETLVWLLHVVGVSVTRPIIKSVSSFSYGPRDGISHVVRWMGRLFYQPVLKSARSFVGWGVSLTCPILESVSSFVGWGVSLTCPVLESVSPFGAWGVCLTRPVMEFVCSFAGWWVSLTSPVLESVRSFVCWDVSVTRRGRSLSYKTLAGICLVSQLVCSLSHTPRAGICLDVRRFRNLSYTPRHILTLVDFVKAPCIVSFSRWSTVLKRHV